MKNIIDYMSNINESAEKLDIEDVVDSIASYLDNDDFAKDGHSSRLCSGWSAVRRNGLDDVIVFHCGWKTLADDFNNCDEEEMQDYIYDHYDEIIKLLKKNYKEARGIY
jgi:hypothetical protein